MWFGSSPSCEKELPRRSRVFAGAFYLAQLKNGPSRRKHPRRRPPLRHETRLNVSLCGRDDVQAQAAFRNYLTRGPAGNRTTTGSLSATSRTPRCQLSHEDDYATFLHELVWQLEFGDNNVFFVHSSGFAAEWLSNIWDLYDGAKVFGAKVYGQELQWLF